MRLYSWGLFALLLLICACLLVYLRLDDLWSSSVDLAHHYALTFRIFDNPEALLSNDPSLGEMNYYPRASHGLAATAGSFFDSPFLGLQVMTLTAVALLWIGVLMVVNAAPSLAAIASMIWLGVIIAISTFNVGLNIHGWEIFGSFFYSQLLGQAVLFIGLGIAVFLEHSRGKWIATLFLLFLAIANINIHLLPALEMLGVVCVLVFVGLFIDGESVIGFARRIALLLAVILVAFLAVLLSPAFSAMQQISKHNAPLVFDSIPYPSGMLTLCALVFLLSVVLWYHWKRQDSYQAKTAYKYLAAYGSTLAGLCLLQYFLVGLGHGSEYAVKKYEYGLVTYIVIVISLLLGAITADLMKLKAFQKISVKGSIRPLVFIVVFAQIFATISHQETALKVSEVVALERQLIEVRDLSLPARQPGTNDVIIGLKGMPPVVNYMFSIAIAKTHRETAISDVLASDQLSNLDQYAHVISSGSHRIYGSEGCKNYGNNIISIVDIECIERRVVK